MATGTADDTARAAERPQPPARSRGGRGAVADMARSLGLVFLFIAVTLMISPARDMILPSHKNPVTVVDPARYVQAAESFAAGPVPTPTGLPHGWRSTSARVDGGNGDPVHLHIGYLTPAGHYAGMDESTGAARPFLESQIGKQAAATVDGRVRIDGEAWQLRHTDVKDEPALTRTAGGWTIVVTGDAARADLQRLAASLRPR